MAIISPLNRWPVWYAVAGVEHLPRVRKESSLFPAGEFIAIFTYINRLCASLQMDHRTISYARPSIVLCFNLIFLGYSNLLALPNRRFKFTLVYFHYYMKERKSSRKENKSSIRRFKDSFCIIFSVLKAAFFILYSCCLPPVIYIYSNSNFLLSAFSLGQKVTFLLLNHICAFFYLWISFSF